MPLIPHCRGGREEKGAGDHGEHEGEAEEEERVARHGGSVPGAKGPLVGAGTEFVGWEGGHGGAAGTFVDEG